MKIIELIGRNGRVDHIGPFPDYDACYAWLAERGLPESPYSILDVISPDAIELAV
jgi:hypothetical protein